MANDQYGDVTQLLHQWSAGNDRAFDELYQLLYRELHSLASSLMRKERPDHTLQPTALVNEAYLRLAGAAEMEWEGRAQFLGIAARAMRRVLVDHARKHQAAKRISGGKKVSLTDVEEPSTDWAVEDLLAVDVALSKLDRLDQRQAQIVELRFFGGLTVQETAAALDISPATVKREWRMARLWIRRELSGPPG